MFKGGKVSLLLRTRTVIAAMSTLTTQTKLKGQLYHSDRYPISQTAPTSKTKTDGEKVETEFRRWPQSS